MSEVQYETNFDSKLFVAETIALNLERVEAVQIADKAERKIVIFVAEVHFHLKGEPALQFLKHYFAFCGQNVPKHFLDVFGVDMFGARIVKGNCEHAWQERTLHHPMGGVTLSRVCKLCGEAGPL